MTLGINNLFLVSESLLLKPCSLNLGDGESQKPCLEPPTVQEGEYLQIFGIFL